MRRVVGMGRVFPAALPRRWTCASRTGFFGNFGAERRLGGQAMLPPRATTGVFGQRFNSISERCSFRRLFRSLPERGRHRHVRASCSWSSCAWSSWVILGGRAGCGKTFLAGPRVPRRAAAPAEGSTLALPLHDLALHAVAHGRGAGRYGGAGRPAVAGSVFRSLLRPSRCARLIRLDQGPDGRRPGSDSSRDGFRWKARKPWRLPPYSMKAACQRRLYNALTLAR